MPLPPGFELESSSAPAVKLPPGFQLETEPKVAKKPTREELIAAIPGEQVKPYVAPPEPGIADKVLGTLETPIAVGQSLLSIPLGAASALYKKATGQPSNIDTEMGRFAYRPSTQTAQSNLETLGRVFEASKLPPMPGVTGGLATQGLNRLAGPAMRQAVASPAAQVIKQEGELLADAIKYPLEQRAAAKQTKRVQQSYDNASKIEAAQEMRDLGYVVDPSLTNPTKGNKIRASLTGKADVREKVIEKNQGVTEARLREDLGLPKNADLRQESVWDAALNREELQKPYNQIRSLENVVDDGSIATALDDLRNKFIWSSENEGPMMRAIDNAKNRLEQGRTGAEVLDGIRQLRKEADLTYKALNKGNQVAADQVTLAEAKMAIADTLEQLLENNIADPKFRDAFRAARTEMAKIYDAKNATNSLTGKVDPFYYANKAKNGQTVTGFGQSLARMAENFPEMFKEPAKVPVWLAELRRSSPSGVMGAGLAASLLGASGADLGIAALAGAGGGVIGSRLMRNYMLSPAYQARNAVPIDYRLPVVNQLAQRAPTPGVPVPYDYAQAVNEGNPSYQPNWTYGRPGVNPDVRAEVPNVQNLLTAPKGTEAMDLVQRQRQWQYQQERAAAEAAAAREEAAAASTRQPASREQLFDFDPITGRLRPSSRGLPGATLDVIESTGKSLESASQKIAAGKNFDLTAAEKVAWDKTRNSLSTVSPEFRNLTDKQILDRMMDRQWIADTVKKSKDKAEAFSQIAARSEKADQIRAALKAREEMMDLAESLDLMMQQGRPVPKSGQGPKTREAIRNMLLGQ